MTDRIAAWIVPSTAHRVRLDQYLASQLPGESRSQVQVWIREGRILVNGLRMKTGYPLRSGDQIRLCAPEAESDAPFPEDIPLEVVYEDADLAVVNKPAGMICHLGAGVHSGTLVNALLHRYGDLDSENAMRPGIVHRLDKLTSGLLVVARNKWTHRELANQFKSRQVRKEYLALVHGVPRPPSGTIDLPLGRDPRERKKISVRARRKRTAITHYSVEKSFGSLALLRIRIETGRTHQIRVHLSHRGHPIVGDPVYGGNRDRSLPSHLSGCHPHRPFLHSQLLAFRHPRSGEMVCFRAAVPPDLESLLAVLEKRR